MDYENLDDLQVPHGNSESVFLPHRAEVELLPVSGLPLPLCVLCAHSLPDMLPYPLCMRRHASPFLGDSEDAET